MKTLIKPSNIVSSNIRAFFTTKILADNRDERFEEIIAGELDIPPDRIYLPIQKHTNRIHILDSDFEPVVADAVITFRSGLLIGVLVADCVPILLFDKHKKVIGAVHAGWRGTAKEILKRTVEAMHENFNSLPENLLIAIGPSIRQCSYEVGEDVNDEISKATGNGNYSYKKGDKYFIDLSTANIIQALSIGVSRENIWQSEECTFCNPERFYSYRHSRDHAGRQGGFIGMW